MTVTTDIFSLETVYRLQILGLWFTQNNIPPLPSYPYGYFGGGEISGPTPISTVDRIDYSNDTATASPKGPLSLARGYLGATSNQSYGYFGAGWYSTVDRIDYSNDTATASVDRKSVV